MTSWRSRLLTSSRRSSARPVGTADSVPAVEAIAGIERFLLGPELLRDVLKVDPNPRPRVKAAAHRIHEHVGRFEMRTRVWVTDPPAFETCERGRFRAAGKSAYDDVTRDAGRFAWLLAVVRRHGTSP
jgi:hypothetical protein